MSPAFVRNIAFIQDILLGVTVVITSMKGKVFNYVRAIAMLGMVTIILSKLLITNQQKRCIGCFNSETNATPKYPSQTEETTLAKTTRTTTQQIRSAYHVLGYANMTLMQKMEEDRPTFEYLVEPWKTKCSDDAADGKKVSWSMIVSVKSSPGNTNRRRIIRETWGSYKYSNHTRLEVFFVVGSPKNTEQEKAVSIESSENGDVLQINKTEEYKEVGLKVIAGMQWVSNHCQSNWVYASSDDDMMPDVINFYRIFESEGVKEMAKSRTSAKRFPIVCNYSLRETGRVARSLKHKNFVPPEIHPVRMYPTFCAGGFYSMSVEICKILFLTSQSHKYFYNDDVWITGLLRLSAIEAGNIPCDDITDVHCAISAMGGDTVRHFKGMEKSMIAFWKEQFNVTSTSN